MNDDKEFRLSCPLPLTDYPHILMAHGGGGRLMHQLIDKIFVAAFGVGNLEATHDGAVLKPPGGRLVFTTDSYVVDPLFFPGGDIGRLAIDGTVNDLAMCGGRPLYISTGFIIEEGLATDDLWRIAQSMRLAADEAEVKIVTGDTKVVDRGRGHGLYINTAGVGVIEHDLEIHPRHLQPGDKIILNGDIGRHGMAVMAARENLSFETTIESDCAPLASSVQALIDGGIAVHCLRDLTRGGLATTLVEIADSSGYEINLDEKKIPINEQVRGACEILGYDPIYVANEGRFIAIVPGGDTDRVVEILKSDWPETAVIGEVRPARNGQVLMTGRLGAERTIDMLSGEQLPRIC